MSAPQPSPKPSAPGDVRLQWPGDDGTPRRQDPPAAPPAVPGASPAPTAAPADGDVASELAALRRAVEELRAEVSGLRTEVTGLRRRLPVRATDPG